MLPITPNKSLSITQLGQGLFVVAIIMAISWALMRSNSEQQSAVPASQALTASQATLKANISERPAKILTSTKTTAKDGKGYDPAAKGSIMKDLNQITKGDGAVRPVEVNGPNVDPVLVKLSMFENGDFMPHDEVKIKAHKQQYAELPVDMNPYSHFGKMTFPMATPRGKLTMDIVNSQTKDLRPHVADQGGRIPAGL
jgi:hypothetical protein